MLGRHHVVILILGLLMAPLAHSAAIRNATEAEEAMETSSTLEMTTEEMDVTTMEALTEETPTTDDPEPKGALSRDEEASILVIDQTLLDPTPTDIKAAQAPSVSEQKFGKLLLLSTPKLEDKTKIPEENFEETDDVMNSSENATDIVMETTTTTTDDHTEEATTIAIESDTKEKDSSMSMEEKDSSMSMESVPTTKLFPINDTLYEKKEKQPETPVETPEMVVMLVAEEEPREEKNSNLRTVVLAETEADYVLVDSDTEVVEEGVYADVDSDLHLQPIVQSVEIVPTSVDDSLLVNYVHNW
ncbi:uncharacterized protein LOC142233852 [Haematobia irritans]|uniref:uncharacterized protein LOC142233852 n=1 Tax=Haematobia irritans TaxID=7368 RepID=UPI003F50559E